MIGANDLRRDNVALLVKKGKISINGYYSPAYTDENWDILAEVIRTTTSLETLSFKFRNAIIVLQNDKVVDALAKNRTIKTLDLGSVYARIKGAKAVAAILKENSTIEEVKLYNNNISGEGAKVIAEALKVNKALRYIDMSSNKIGDGGAKAIADALKHNTSVQTIYLRWNNIGNEGAKAIAEALKESASLQTLSMVNNYIGQEGGEHILNALQQIESSEIRDVVLWEDKAWKETQRKINHEIARIQRRFRIAGSVAHSAENENKEHQEDTVVEDMKLPPRDPVRENKKPLLIFSPDDYDNEREVEEGRSATAATTVTPTKRKRKVYSFAICKTPNCTKLRQSSCNGYCTTCQFNQQLDVDDNDDESPFDDPPRLGEGGRGARYYCKVKKCDKWSQGKPKMGMCCAHFTYYRHYQREKQRKKRVNDDINNFLNDQKKKANDDVNNFLNAWLLRPENVHNNPMMAATPTTEVKEWMVKELCVERSCIDSWFYRRRKKLKKQDSPDQAANPSSVTTSITASHLLTKTSSGTNPNLNYQAQNKLSESKVGAQTSQLRHVLLASSRPTQMNQPQPSSKPKQHDKQQSKQQGQPIVKPEDMPLLLDYFYLGFEQYHTCSLQDSERREQRYKKFGKGYPGIACKHCDGQANRRSGSGHGRYFPSSEAALYQQTFSNNAVRHLLECPYCPKEVKKKLSAMKEELDNTDGKGKFVKEKGGRLRFFRRVWCRLHGIPIDKETASPIQIKRRSRSKELKRKREQWESEKTPSATDRIANEPSKKVMKPSNPYPTKEMRDKIMAHLKIENPRTLDGFLTFLKLLKLQHKQSENEVSAQTNQPRLHRSGMESTASKPAKTRRICRQSDCNKNKQHKCDGYCIRHYRDEMKDKIMAHLKIENPRTLYGFMTLLKLLNLQRRQSENKVSAQTNQPRLHRSGMESTASKPAKTRRICRQSDCNKNKQHKCDGYCIRHYRDIVLEGGEKGFEEGKEEEKVTEAAATVGDKAIPDVAKPLSAEPSEEDGKTGVPEESVAELTLTPFGSFFTESPPTLAEAATAGCKKCRLEYETGEKTRKAHNDDCPRKWKSTGKPPPGIPAQMNRPQSGIASAASPSTQPSQMNRFQPGMVSTVNKRANSAQRAQSRVAVGTAQVSRPKPVSTAAKMDLTQNAIDGRQYTNVTGQEITAMETKIRELQSTVAQQQVQLAGKDANIAQRDKEIASVMMEKSQTTRQLAEQQSTISQLRGNLAQKHEEFASIRMQMQRLNNLDVGSEHLLESYTKCCVCLEPYEEEQNSSGSQRLPIKSATCAHSLCEDCLGRYHASQMKGRSKRYIRCPQCNDKSKRAFDIQNKVVDSFLREYIHCRRGKRKYHTTLQSEPEIERYKKEIDSLKGQLKKQAQQMVEAEEEAKKRVTAAEAYVEKARREKTAVEASLRDAQEKHEEAEKRIAAAEAYVEKARREKSQQQKKQMKDEQPQPQQQHAPYNITRWCLALGCRDFAAAGFFCPAHEHLNKLQPEQQQQQQQWPQPLPAAEAVKQITPVKESGDDEALRDAQEQEDLEDEVIVHV